MEQVKREDGLGAILERIAVMQLPYLRLSLTADCNAECSFCHNEGQRIGLRGENARSVQASLPLEDYERMAEFFRGTFDRVKLTGGEPTLVNELPEIVKIFASHGYDVSMTSNGFALDESLQEKLAFAGLRGVNVSIPSTDPDRYRSLFGEQGNVVAVLNNMRTLAHYFPGEVKMNFMAVRGLTIPDELVPISKLSAELRAQVSVLQLATRPSMNDNLTVYVTEELDSQIGIVSCYERPEGFLTRTILELRNGALWEIDDFRKPEHRAGVFDNDYCGSCVKKSSCIEGPYALRVRANGVARSCLIRSDNEMQLVPLLRAGNAIV